MHTPKQKKTKKTKKRRAGVSLVKVKWTVGYGTPGKPKHPKQTQNNTGAAGGVLSQSCYCSMLVNVPYVHDHVIEDVLAGQRRHRVRASDPIHPVPGVPTHPFDDRQQQQPARGRKDERGHPDNPTGQLCPADASWLDVSWT